MGFSLISFRCGFLFFCSRIRPGGAKPVFTIAVMAVCLVLHFGSPSAELLRVLPFNPLHPYGACVSAPAVWYDGQVGRLLWAGLLHADGKTEQRPALAIARYAV